MSVPELFSADFLADPYPSYAHWRRTEPVHRTALPGGLPVWVVTRYADVRRALVDRRLSIDPSRMSSWPAGLRPPRHLLNMDPPDHTRLRRVVAEAFTARRAEALRERVHVLTTGLIDRFLPNGRAELMTELAFPLPATVIGELLGVPASDLGGFRQLAESLLVGHPTGRQRTEQTLLRYLAALIRRKRAAPGDDLLSDLIAARAPADGGPDPDPAGRGALDDGELSAMAFLLLIAGFESTANLIGKGMLALLTDPDRLTDLRDEPALLPRAVEEFLRIDSPIEVATFRVPIEPVEIGGCLIPAGETVLLVLASTGRDDERYDAADTLDVHRPASQHLAFGHGIHYCLGAPLARVEGQVVFGELLSRCPKIRLDASDAAVRWGSSTIGRSLAELRVVW